MGDSLIIRIGANAKQFDDELKKIKSKTKSLEKGLASVAKISAGAFAGLATSVGIAVRKFTSFEKTFTNVQTLLDKSSFSTKTLSKGIQGLRNDVLKLGADSGESFQDLNQGLFDLISAGVPAEEATLALADAVDLATAGATNTATSVKALTAAITAYGDEAGTSTEIAEKFFTAQKFGVTTVEELATGFNKVAGNAKALKIGFNEILAASTALTANGAKPTSQAFTEMRAVMTAVVLAQSKLKSESKEVQDALSLQNIEQKGIVTALDELKIATGGSVVEMQKLLGSSEALSAVLSLTGQQAGTYKKILSELNDEQARAASFNDALVVKQKTTEKSLARLSRSFESIAIQLGERFVPLINKAADALSDMAKDFNELTDDQKDSLATFIKWTTAIVGGITALSVVALGIIKLSALLGTIVGIFTTAGGAAATFWLAVTGPVGLAVAGLLAVGAGVAALYNILSDDEPVKSLEEINSELDKLKAKQDEVSNAEVNNGFGASVRQEKLDDIQREIDKLEDLRKKKIEVANTQETGSLLLRPETDGSDPLAGIDKDLSGRKPIAVPLAAQGNLEVKALKKNEAEKKAVIDQATQDRIDSAKRANEELKNEAINVSAEELDFIRQKNDLLEAEEEAKNIKNEELRALELENIGLQKEALLEQEREFQELKTEEIALAREKEDELNASLGELELEKRQSFNDKELADLRNQVKTKDQIKAESNKAEAVVEINKRNKFLKDELEHGTAIAVVNKALASDAVVGAERAAGSLVALQNSKNKTLKAIGKKAAQVQVAIDTAKGAVSAFTAFVGIPFVGVALGTAAAAAVISYGAERISTIQSAQRGGVVPNSIGGGSRDRVPMLLEPDELVVPKGLAPDFIQSVGRPDAQAGEGGGAQGAIVEIAIEDDATDFITAKQRENDSLAIGIGA